MSEQTPFQPPTLEQRAPDAIQEQLGDPMAAGWAMAQAVPEQRKVSDGFARRFDPAYAEKEAAEATVPQRIRARVQAIREGYGKIPERRKDKMQLRAMIGASAVMSLYTVHTYAEKYAGFGDKAAVTAGLYGLGTVAAYKVHKYGLPSAGIKPAKKYRK